MAAESMVARGATPGWFLASSTDWGGANNSRGEMNWGRSNTCRGTEIPGLLPEGGSIVEDGWLTRGWGIGFRAGMTSVVSKT